MASYHYYSPEQKNLIVGFVMENDFLGNRLVGVGYLDLKKEFVDKGKMNAYQLTEILRACLASGRLAVNGDLKYLFKGERDDTIVLG